MWPFDPTKNYVDAINEFNDACKETNEEILDKNLAKLKKFRAIGKTFNYCGIKMLVERIEKTVITTAYKNSAGELKYAYFRVENLPALYAENKIK